MGEEATDTNMTDRPGALSCSLSVVNREGRQVSSLWLGSVTACLSLKLSRTGKLGVVVDEST